MKDGGGTSSCNENLRERPKQSQSLKQTNMMVVNYLEETIRQ